MNKEQEAFEFWRENNRWCPGIDAAWNAAIEWERKRVGQEPNAQQMTVEALAHILRETRPWPLVSLDETFSERWATSLLPHLRFVPIGSEELIDELQAVKEDLRECVQEHDRLKGENERLKTKCSSLSASCCDHATHDERGHQICRITGELTSDMTPLAPPRTWSPQCECRAWDEGDDCHNNFCPFCGSPLWKDREVVDPRQLVANVRAVVTRWDSYAPVCINCAEGVIALLEDIRRAVAFEELI